MQVANLCRCRTVDSTSGKEKGDTLWGYRLCVQVRMPASLLLGRGNLGQAAQRWFALAALFFFLAKLDSFTRI